MTERISRIERNGLYLVLLLIFGYPHSLLWECASFEQFIQINIVNNITFDVNDVCK